MNVEPGTKPKYDVFLSHNSVDKPAVEELARRLAGEAGLNPFLDKWHLVPGEPWQEALEAALTDSKTVAVFLGPTGISPWENEEMRSALEERVHDKTRRVIPVLLPGAPEPRDRPLPRFLRRLTWVDFRGGLTDEEAFNRLVAGIRGAAPGQSVRPSSASSSAPTGQEMEAYLREERGSLQRQLLQHQANLNKLREQAAIYGGADTPLHLLNKIKLEETEIERLELELSALEDKLHNR